MDTRVISPSRAESKLGIEDSLWRELEGHVARLPGRGHPDFDARDIALGVAIRAFWQGTAEKQRKALTLLRQAEFDNDPEEQADLYDLLEELFGAMKRDAIARIEPERDPVTGRAV